MSEVSRLTRDQATKILGFVVGNSSAIGWKADHSVVYEECNHLVHHSALAGVGLAIHGLPTIICFKLDGSPGEVASIAITTPHDGEMKIRFGCEQHRMFKHGWGEIIKAVHFAACAFGRPDTMPLARNKRTLKPGAFRDAYIAWEKNAMAKQDSSQ